MLRKIALVAACIAMLMPLDGLARQYSYESVPGDMMKTRVYTLDNGLKVYLSVNNEKPRIQTYVAVRTGSRNDPAETTGLAHYLEHLMFKGTTLFGTSDAEAEKPLLDAIETCYEQYRQTTDPELRKEKYREIDSLSQVAAQYNIPNEYDKLMASIGSEGSNAYTSDDVTCYTENIPSNEVDNWAKVQAERFRNMVIRGFHTELEAVYEEYNMGLTNDMFKAYTALSKKLFPNHPYGTQTTIGTQEHLKNPSIVNIKNYFSRYYVPNNTAIIMAGDLDPDKTIETIDRYFGTWQPSDSIKVPHYEPVRDLIAHADTTVSGSETDFLMLGWKFDAAASAQADTLQVVSYLLNNGTAGLLDLDVNQRVLCGGASAFHYLLNEYSMLMMTGVPKDGQTLDEVRDILLTEIERLRDGDFDGELVTAVVNNLKLDRRRAMEDNKSRADILVDAFINGIDMQQTATFTDRISTLTKQDIVGFARRHFGDNYAAVYKEMGDDTTQNKIDKPQITAIPANRDMESGFVSDIVNSTPEPIQPRFLDFTTDITITDTRRGLPLKYVKDDTNGTFTLVFRYDIGEENDKWLPFAAMYADLIGTETMSAEQRKQRLYRSACEMSIDVGHDFTTVSLTGLAENMSEALTVVEDFLAGMQADEESYSAFLDLVESDRRVSKLNQQANFYALRDYGRYGTYNPQLNIPDSTELHMTKPDDVAAKIRRLNGYVHQALYCGPLSIDTLSALVDACHKMPAARLTAEKTARYELQATPANEIILAPYTAKNIFMMQYNNEGLPFNPDDAAPAELFNEYFGGGMNSVVFQELRESRALAYSAGARYVMPGRQGTPNYAFTQIISQNDKLIDCIAAFNEIINNMPQSDKAFELAKQSLMKQYQTARTTKFGIIDAYLAAQRLGIDYDLKKKIYDDLQSITLDDIVRFEHERMADKPYLYLILGDENELDIEALEKIAPVKRVTTEQIFGY